MFARDEDASQRLNRIDMWWYEGWREILVEE
jgi:hypothetical protein